MIRLGLIGAGKWGKNYIEAVKEAGNCELAWVAGKTVWREQSPVDGLIIATPPEPRTEIIRAWSDFPMMVEKPLCLSMADATSIQAALRPEVPFLVNYQHLFSPKYEAMRQRFATGVFGGPPGAHGIVPRVLGRARGPEVRSYSLLWDYGPHFLAMAAGLGAKLEDVVLDLAVGEEKFFEMCVQYPAGPHSTEGLFYNGRTERPLVHAVRAFAQAVQDGGTDDWRFGVEMSLKITQELERRSLVFESGLKDA